MRKESGMWGKSGRKKQLKGLAKIWNNLTVLADSIWYKRRINIILFDIS